MNPMPPQGVILNLQPPQDGGPFREEQAPPARVMVSLTYLRDLHRKYDSKIAVNDMTMEEYRQGEPEKDERLTMNSSLRCIRNYLDGELQPDEQEKYRRKSNQNDKTGGPSRNRKGGTVTACALCMRVGHPVDDCPACDGGGQVLCFPLYEKQE